MEIIFVTGASGLLGSNLVMAALPKFNVYGAYNKNRIGINGAQLLQIDLAEESQLKKIEDIKPHLIIHCAAQSNVDYCQQYPDEAHRSNVSTSVNIARAAKKTGAYLIHISTVSIFDGKKGNYNEDDKPEPLNVYAKTKLEAEERVLSIYPDSAVVRTNIYGWNKIEKFSLAEWMLDKLKRKEELKGLKDIYFSPILVNDLAQALFKLAHLRYKGIIHIASSQRCSKLEFAYKIADVFCLDKSPIRPITISELGLKAPRPKDVSLNVSRAEDLLRMELPTVEEGLRHMKRLSEEGYVDRLKG